MSNLTREELEDISLYNNPEKWYIRDKWKEYAILRKQKKGKNYVNYLTLTCTQIYDVKYFMDNSLLKKTATGLDKTSLTFCEQIGVRSEIIRRKLAGARCFSGPIEELGKNPERYNWFPFDVINYNPTGAPFKKDTKFIEGIKNFFTFQKIHKSPFTLFVTISCDEKDDDKGNIEKIKQFYLKNLENGEIKNNIIKKYPKATLDNYCEFLLFIIPKMIVEFGFDNDFNVTCQERYKYIGTGNKKTMVSFIFECDYLNPFLDPNEHNKNRVQKIIKILEKDYIDINNCFIKNPKKRQEFVTISQRY